jgi:Ran GTPase-activating protein (RanGAP) involved in mRNA processing and transport
LSKNQSIEYFDISKNLLGEKGASEISFALRINKTLKHLNISANQIGEIGVCKIAGSLSSKRSIEWISFSAISYGLEGTKSIGILLESDFLHHLELNEKTFTAEESHIFALALRVNKSLRHLHLDQCIFSNFGFAEILTAICEMRALETLTFRRVNFNNMQRVLLIESLYVMHSLSRLDISGSQMSSEDLESLCTALNSNSGIHFLSILHIRVDQSDILDRFMELIRSNERICELSIDACNSSTKSSIDSACKSNFSLLKRKCRIEFFRFVENLQSSSNSDLLDVKIFWSILFPMANI